MNGDDRRLWILPAVFGGLGILSLAAATPLYLRERAFERLAVETDAVVVRTDHPIWSKQARASVEFTTNVRAGRTPEARAVTATVYASGSFERFTVGQRLRVLYDPLSPETVAIAGSPRGWVLPVVFGGLGGLFVVAAIVAAAVLMVRRRRRAPAFPAAPFPPASPTA